RSHAWPVPSVYPRMMESRKYDAPQLLHTATEPACGHLPKLQMFRDMRNPGRSRTSGGSAGPRSIVWHWMKSQKGGGGLASALRHVAQFRPVGHAHQQAHQSIAQEETAELVDQFIRSAVEHTGRLSFSHNVAQRGAAGFPSY